MKKKNDKRIILELSDKANQQLKELKIDLNAFSGAHVVSQSLKLMSKLNKEHKCGSEIIIKNPKQTKRLLFL